ncbi:MAG: type IV pilus secretin PilQ [Pasteurella oralis]|uniref:type IV pilus secretin PilQ n=1 Tax=Pasteurella oralis TaxID=1071947 RepID=UPI002706BAC6|nr:type IV pilus secretin PilQ [Pasteurella oralis]
MQTWIKPSIKCGLFWLSFVWCAVAQPSDTFSIRLKQAPLVETLQQLALQQNKNLVIDDELDGALSLQLEQTTFDQLLHAVAKIKQLELHKEGKLYYLSRSFKTGSVVNDNAPVATNLVTTSVKLQFAKAEEVMKSLTTGNGSLLSANGSISFDERSNLLLIQDQAESVRDIKQLVMEMDKPVEQIVIEARIVTMTDESLKELGVRWGMFEPTQNVHSVSGSLEGNGLVNIQDHLNVNFATNVTPAGTVALQLAKINGRLLDLELTALERENNVEIIASPRLLTTNKKSASIKQGTEIPYVITSGKNNTQSIEFREAVLGLDVTPQISKDDTILLDLVVSQNSLGPRVAYDKSEIVSIDKQEINTQVFAKDGETIVLGGVFHDTITKGVDKVPVLGDLPVLKRLFSKESERHQKRELVIFVTPHILRQNEAVAKLEQKRPDKKFSK